MENMSLQIKQIMSSGAYVRAKNVFLFYNYKRKWLIFSFFCSKQKIIKKQKL